MAENKKQIRVSVVVTIASSVEGFIPDWAGSDMVRGILDEKKGTALIERPALTLADFSIADYKDEADFQRERWDRSIYRDEVKELAKGAVDTALEHHDWKRSAPQEISFDNLRETVDTNVHETVDGHEWIIYTKWHAKVIDASDNEDHFIDNFGAEAAGDLIKEGGIDKLTQSIAFFALRQDVMEAAEEMIKELEEAAENYEEPEEDEEEEEEEEATPAE